MTFTACGESTPIEVKINPIDSSSITVHSEMVSNFYQSSAYDASDLPSSVTAENDVGDNLPIKLSWNSNGSSDQQYNVVLIDSEQKLNYTVQGNSFDFYNYKLNTEYTMRIEVGNYVSESISFTTPSGFVRTIKVDGVNNFRDLGGYGDIKQGLIYRCTTFENNTITNKEITSSGIEELHNLGIKSEIDLRRSNERGDNYDKIEGINYQFKPLYYGGQNILKYKNSEYDNPARIKEIFDFLASKDHYPVSFHCQRGTDRTGCIAFIIKGLLGVSEEYLKKDFIFSNFYQISTDGTKVAIKDIEWPTGESRFVNSLKLEEGDTLQEKIYNYMHNKIGVSEENLNSLINILKVNND